MFFLKKIRDWNRFPHKASADVLITCLGSAFLSHHALTVILGNDNMFIFQYHTQKFRVQKIADIGNVITKYVDVEPENIEIKVILKEYKKRELQCLNSTN